MEATDHTIAVGDLVPATIDGKPRILTVTRAGHGLIHTSDWKCWWYQQPDHEDGTPIRGGVNHLHTDQPAPVEADVHVYQDAT